MKSDGQPPTLSVVVPCYNEEEVLPLCAQSLQEQLHRLMRAGKIRGDSHVVFVNDGSTDRTWAMIEDLYRRTGIVRGLKLSRNRGHQNALLAGLLSALGDVVITVDADLQDDIAAMEEMIDAYAGGCDVVLGVRRARPKDSLFKKVTAHAYYSLLEWLGVEIVHNHADYRLLSRRAIEALRGYKETNLFLRALVVQLGFRTAIVTYDRRNRPAGVSKYPLRKMVALAIDGVTSFSAMPLRYLMVAGCIVMMLSLSLSVWAVISFLLSSTIPGWASTVVPMYFLSGVQIICLGVIGEYVGKIYSETKQRPRFVIEESLVEARRPQASLLRSYAPPFDPSEATAAGRDLLETERRA